MKPNHNYTLKHSKQMVVVYTMSKIQNETKSQPIATVHDFFMSCLYYVKDTK